MLSAIICGMGYFTTLWGQLKDDETSKNIKGRILPTTSDEKVPLLEEREEDGDEEVEGDSKV